MGAIFAMGGGAVSAEEAGGASSSSNSDASRLSYPRRSRPLFAAATKSFLHRTSAAAACAMRGTARPERLTIARTFVTSAESTMASVPVAVSEVNSPAALTAAVKHHALTYLRLSKLADLFDDTPPAGGGLRWNDQYSGTTAFVSDGPIIDTWDRPPLINNFNTNERRVWTLGAERFVTGVALQPVSISVRSADGELSFENLSETEKSAATIGVAADAWKPISWLNQGHYGELLRNNALSGPLTQKIEAFKTVSSR